MGCFSYLCNECGKPVNSTSFRGQMVKLFLFDSSNKIVEQMEGEYDSYGRVFNKDCSEPIHWSIPWSVICDSYNIAAIHSKCYKKPPTEPSENDPDQGWGRL